MPQTIVFVSLGDIIVSSLALLFASYEGWLWWTSGRAESARRQEHFWLALICVCAAVFAGGMAVQYNIAADRAIWAMRAEAVALVGLVHAIAMLVLRVTGQRRERLELALAIHAAFWIVLGLAPVTIADVELREMAGLAHPYVRRVNTVAGTIGSLSAFGIAGGAILSLWRHRAKHPVDTRWFGVAMSLWLLAGAHDFVQALSPGPLWPPLLEYGFVAFAGTLVARDMHRYREMLERGQRDFRELIERNPDGVVVFRRGQLVWANEAAQGLMRSTAAELAGRHVTELIDADVAHALLDELAVGAVGPIDVTIRRLDGSEAEAEIVVVATDFDGGPASVVVARDTTARRELTARMIEMDRMITAGTLSAGVGHEINNPLSYAMLNLSEARRDPSSIAQDELLAASEEGMRRVEQVVRALRSFARADQEDRVVPVERVVQSAIAITSNELRMRARVEVDVEPDLGVRGGETRLGQIVINLLVNAAQAIVEGHPDDNLVRVRAYRRDDQAVIEVSDTGQGIAEEDQERIFDAFFTTKPVTVGTGLGLSICQQKVRELDGELTVESAVGKGTTFRVVVAAAPFPAVDASGALEESGPRPVPQERVRVLLVDDEVALLAALARMLRRTDDVVTATSTAEAIAVLEGGERFDLVISDLMMPGESGIVLYEAVERRWPEVAETMLFMSGGAFTNEAQEFCQRMGDRVLPKPLDVDVVLARLRARLEDRAAAIA